MYRWLKLAYRCIDLERVLGGEELCGRFPVSPVYVLRDLCKQVRANVALETLFHWWMTRFT